MEVFSGCLIPSLLVGIFGTGGSPKIYDGSFSNTIVDYDAPLQQEGIEVYSEEEISIVDERLKTLEFESRI